jgi:hypothetical protein
MALDLRPLTLPELLDRTFSTYRRHVWLFGGIMAAPAAVGLLYAISLQLLQFSSARTATPKTAEDVMWAVLPIAIGALAFLLLSVAVYALAQGATTVAVARVYTGEAVTVGDAYRAVRSQGVWILLTIIWSAIRVVLAGLGVFAFSGVLAYVVGFLLSRVLGVLILIPGALAAVAVLVYFTLRYGVAVPALVLENLGPNRAIARSVELTEDYRGRIFLIMLCSTVITYAAMALLQMPFLVAATLAGPLTASGRALNLGGAVLGSIATTFTGPIMTMGLALAYYDLRIRKEAFDLQMMLDAIDAPRE